MKTDFLFAQPSFVGGVASVVDLEGMNFYNESVSAFEADETALRSDWEMVGGDMREALMQYEQKQK